MKIDKMLREILLKTDNETIDRIIKENKLENFDVFLDIETVVHELDGFLTHARPNYIDKSIELGSYL